MQVLYTDGTGGEFASEITGVVTNNTGRTIRYARISFAILDKQGRQVGNAFDNVAGLEPHGSWKFKATFFGDDWKSYRLLDLEYR